MSKTCRYGILQLRYRGFPVCMMDVTQGTDLKKYFMDEFWCSVIC